MCPHPGVKNFAMVYLSRAFAVGLDAKPVELAQGLPQICRRLFHGEPDLRNGLRLAHPNNPACHVARAASRRSCCAKANRDQ